MLSTPTMSTAFENEARDAVESGVKTLESNWKNSEVKHCKKCRGSKFVLGEMERCAACDGTGIDMLVEYGVEDGKFFSRITQNGVDALAALCREYRELEASMSLTERANRAGVPAYMLPSSAHMELEAKYEEFSGWMSEANQKKCANIVRRLYPQFMCTNYIF